MSETIKELAEKRRKWVDANRENGFEAGIKRLLTDLYPDNAHFIYELLQNAEDAGAHVVRFVLFEDRIEFEHDGNKAFSIFDVNAITSIGFSTKREDTTTIGKFGVGFKAVFAYTDTPEIISDVFHFKISDLVVPEEIDPSILGSVDGLTRFILPFNSPKKSSKQAINEVEMLLRALNADTLLFLTKIQRIEYILQDSKIGCIERVDLGDNKYEIRVQKPEAQNYTPSFFLKFDKIVDIEDKEEMEEKKTKKCNIAVAFKIAPKKSKIDSKESVGEIIQEHTQWELVLMIHGAVCIYFPADKETSNLCFHVHAPFASTVARDSVRDCGGNNSLRDHLAELLAESMHKIRDMGLLTVSSLALLPNEKDNLRAFYKPLMERLIREFKNEELVPMKRGGHAAASGIFRGSKAFSDLLEDNDFAMLLGDDYFSPMWVANPSQLNQREDNFLSMLDIQLWSIGDLVGVFSNMDADRLAQWLATKSDEWHYKLYSQLYDYFENTTHRNEVSKNKIIILKINIVKCSDGIYRDGSNCYFPSNEVVYDEILPRVSLSVYSNADNKKAKKFLEFIGVCDVDRVIEIEGILKYKYSQEAIKSQRVAPDIKDILKFIKFINEFPNNKNVFNDYYIFKLRDGGWGTADAAYIDSPYFNTELQYWYALQDVLPARQALSAEYGLLPVDPSEIGRFAMEIGVQSTLLVEQQRAESNPNWEYLSRKGGCNYTGTGVNIDYRVSKLADFLFNSSITRSALVWRTMCSICEKNHYCEYLRARFGRNASNIAESPSTLVYELCQATWVPQEYHGWIEYVRPIDAVVDRLPSEGFVYETGWAWIRAIEFGRSCDAKAAIQQSENEKLLQEKYRALLESEQKNKFAKEFGFESQDEAKEIAKLKSLDPTGYRRWKDSVLTQPEFPKKAVINPERRQQRVNEQITIAPEKKYEKRERSVRTSRVTIDPTIYLRENYTNDSGQMVCQICKEEHFRKRDGGHYFEKIELFSLYYLQKEHEAQYLALCPLCAAKYNEFIKNDEDMMGALKELIASTDDCEIPISLCNKSTSLRFVESHFQDLKAIIDSLG